MHVCISALDTTIIIIIASQKYLETLKTSHNIENRGNELEAIFSSYEAMYYVLTLIGF